MTMRCSEKLAGASTARRLGDSVLLSTLLERETSHFLQVFEGIHMATQEKCVIKRQPQLPMLPRRVVGRSSQDPSQPRILKPVKKKKIKREIRFSAKIFPACRICAE